MLRNSTCWHSVDFLVKSVVAIGVAAAARWSLRLVRSRPSVVSAVGARRLSFDADVLSLLPRDGRVIQAFRTFLAGFGSLDQLYVVFTAPDGHAIAEYARRDRRLGRSGCGTRRRSRGSMPAWPIARATSAGSPTASCCCCATVARRRRCAA